MAYYMNPKEQKKKAQKAQENKPKDTRMMRFFYQILGCVIVLVIFLIVYLIKEV